MCFNQSGNEKVGSGNGSAENWYRMEEGRPRKGTGDEITALPAER